MTWKRCWRITPASEPGKVRSVVVTREQSRGFGFVEYENAIDAQRASESLDGFDVDGRKLSVRVQRVSEG